MRLIFFTLLFLFFTFKSGFTQQTMQKVNAIIGDQSFTEAFDRNPDAKTDEKLRIKTHLSFVENYLETQDLNLRTLTPEQKHNREKMLTYLHEYNEAGKFPKNLECPNQRVPCFISDDGQICALGYLIEQSAGRSVAEALNATMQYEYVMDMESPLLETWIAQSGLTKKECAMIQPTYSYRKEPVRYVDPPDLDPYLSPNQQLMAKINNQKTEIQTLKQKIKANNSIRAKHKILIKDLKNKNQIIEQYKNQKDSLTAIIHTIHLEKKALNKNYQRTVERMEKQKKSRMFYFILSLVLGIGTTLMGTWYFVKK